MIERSCGVPEERWVDWHLGKLSPDASEAMARHLRLCPECRYACRQWAIWLAPEEQERGDAGNGVIAPKASERLRAAWRRKARRISIRRHCSGKTAAYAGGIAAVIGVLVGLVWLLAGGGESPPTYVQPPDTTGKGYDGHLFFNVVKYSCFQAERLCR